MLLTQGPWLPLVLADSPPQPEPSILLDNAVSDTAEIDNSDAITDQYYQIMTDSIGDGGERDADAEAQAAEAGLNEQIYTPFDPGLDQALYYQPQLDADAIQGEREIPQEAYLPIPDELPPYDDRQTFTLENEIEPDEGGGGGGGGGVKVYDATVVLSNLTRPGALDFRVGESFRLDIKGAPGQSVRVESTRNSDIYPSTLYGVTDAQGNWSLTGVQDVSSRGVWLEKWFVGETVAFPILNFPVN